MEHNDETTIEHIYDLQDFFSNIRQINPDIVSVFTTSANPENYFKVRQLKRLQLKESTYLHNLDFKY